MGRLHFTVQYGTIVYFKGRLAAVVVEQASDDITAVTPPLFLETLGRSEEETGGGEEVRGVAPLERSSGSEG